MNKNSFLTWVGSLLLALSGTELPGADAPAPMASRWQEHLTLGPGDALNFILLSPNLPETQRAEVPIGPDGRISFLQARDIPAQGLTIDELRGKVDEALGPFYQNPRTSITPAAMRSKRYFVLGAVVNKGSFTFERPLTVIEAIARAGGLESGLYEQRTVDMADLPHSFLVRHGQRVPVDFERLFQRGDLSQNVALEPDDYLYFASASANEIYLLGEVANPGVVAYAPRASVISTIAARGGFTGRSFRSKVLVVRGSFEKPETFVVDTSAILKGKTQDFKLLPKDVVYVSSNPWVVATEILDTAARAFIQGFIVESTTLHVGPIITSPLIK